MTQSGHGQEGQSWGQAPGQPWGPPPPQAVPGEDPATQYLRPVPPASAPLPPERGQAAAESTAFLGTGLGAQPGPVAPQPPPPYQPPQQPPQYQSPQQAQQPPQYQPPQQAQQPPQYQPPQQPPQYQPPQPPQSQQPPPGYGYPQHAAPPGYGYPQPGPAQPGYGYPQQPGYGYPQAGPAQQPPQAGPQSYPPQQSPQGYPHAQGQPQGNPTQGHPQQQPPQAYDQQPQPQAYQQPQQPQQHRPPQPDPDSEATQFIPPVPGDSGPPAEFDSLFRNDTPGATQQMPRIDASAPHPPGRPQPPYQGHQANQPPPPYGRQTPPPHGAQAPHGAHGAPPPHGAHGYGDQDDYVEPERRRSKVPLVAAVVVGCAVVGLGAGALLSGGDEEPAVDKAGAASPVAPAPGPSAPASSEPAPDPVKDQAVELDKLLADSNDSRDAVIRSVENIKKCEQLDKAASDLREAAGQRRELVNRLRGIEIDKLPNHTELSASLTKAWQASAKADDHYAAWADQVKKPKNCKDGKARNTGSTAQAAVASGEATGAKREAARLWNGIAETYGLTKRQPTQL
ncbi:hypothetical protein [Streptomyces fradiae]|uniref:hypothetical protein n=1 Tax=Streptomyces fradiae TaxID=1906 RepID=UPI003985D8E4